MRLACSDAGPESDCSGDAVVINAWISNAIRRASYPYRIMTVPLCARHASGLRGCFSHAPLREGVWLPPLLWTYHRIVLYSERHIELECALGGRQ